MVAVRLAAALLITREMPESCVQFLAFASLSLFLATEAEAAAAASATDVSFHFLSPDPSFLSFCRFLSRSLSLCLTCTLSLSLARLLISASLFLASLVRPPLIRKAAQEGEGREELRRKKTLMTIAESTRLVMTTAFERRCFCCCCSRRRETRGERRPFLLLSLRLVSRCLSASSSVDSACVLCLSPFLSPAFLACLASASSCVSLCLPLAAASASALHLFRCASSLLPVPRLLSPSSCASPLSLCSTLTRAPPDRRASSRHIQRISLSHSLLLTLLRPPLVRRSYPANDVLAAVTLIPIVARACHAEGTDTDTSGEQRRLPQPRRLAPDPGKERRETRESPVI